MHALGTNRYFRAEEHIMTGLLAMDREGQYIPALRMLGRLGFANMQWHVAHVQPMFTPVGTPFLSGDEVRDEMQRDQLDAHQFVRDSMDELCRYDITPRMHVMEGAVAASVVELAEKTDADLVAVGSNQHGLVASILLGSVGRALAIGARQSLLIGRGQVAEDGPVSAIFATDHSYYATRALYRLIAMHPTGIKFITVVTAYDSSELKNSSYFAELEKEAKQEGHSMQQKMRELSESAVRGLRSAGYAADYDLKPGKVRDVLTHAMKEHKADLLILGAQGHGFFDRVLLGSVALQQVVSEPYSLLVIRP